MVPAPQFDPGRVDVTGAGDLDFDPDPHRFPVADFDDGRTESSWVLLRIDHSGAPKECEASRPFLASGFDRELCDQLMQRARFRLARGYDLAFERGYLRIVFTVAPEVAPLRPVRLLPEGKGREIELRVNRGVVRNPCTVTTRGLTKEDAEALCAAYMASRDGRRPPVKDAPAEAETVKVRVAVRPDPPAGKAARVNWQLGIAPRLGPLAYPSENDVRDQRLSGADGKIVVPVSSEDYPAAALANGLRGRAVVLTGVARDGSIVSCRPLATSGAPILDNTTCRIVAERGRFEFAAEVPKYDGVRYTTYSINWNIAP